MALIGCWALCVRMPGVVCGAGEIPYFIVYFSLWPSGRLSISQFAIDWYISSYHIISYRNRIVQSCLVLSCLGPCEDEYQDCTGR